MGRRKSSGKAKDNGAASQPVGVRLLQVTQARCPVCHKDVPVAHMNAHLDGCLAGKTRSRAGSTGTGAAQTTPAAAVVVEASTQQQQQQQAQPRQPQQPLQPQQPQQQQQSSVTDTIVLDDDDGDNDAKGAGAAQGDTDSSIAAAYKT